jgi:hypothetical protein
MFQTFPLSIIRSYSLDIQQWYMSYRFVDSFRASWSCSKVVYKPVWHIPLLSVQWITPDDGQRNCPKHVVSFQNKFGKSVHLVGYIIRKFVMMHGHLNVKFDKAWIYLWVWYSMHWTNVTLYNNLHQRMLMPHPTKLSGNTFRQLETSDSSLQYQYWQKHYDTYIALWRKLLR